MENWSQIYFICAAVLTGWWFFLYLKGHNRYQELLDASDDAPFLKEFFGIGYAFLVLIRYRCDTTARKKQIRKIAEVEDERSAERCFLFLRAGECTYIFTAIPIGLCLSILAETADAVYLGPLLAVTGIILMENSYNKRVEKKHEEVLMQLPTVVSKLVLLMNSGMILRDAWNRVSTCGTGVLYQEMQQVTEEVRNGHMEIDAYRRFSERCSGKEIRKFTAIILQNLSKGNDELLRYLSDLSAEMWDVKKNEVQKKADAAVRRLLFPMFLVFGTVLAMIVVPLLSGIVI